MVDTPISKMTAAGTHTGDEITEISQLSTTVTISAATISAQASDNSFNDSGNGFVAAGFAVDDYVHVAGFTGNTANNIFSGKITALTAGKMTIGGTDGDVIVDDSAGETVTISKWVTRRESLSQISDWEPIGSPQSASNSATIDFTGIDPNEWDALEISALNVVAAVDNTDLWLRVGTGAGPTFATGASDYSFGKRGLFGTTGAGTGFSATDTTFDAMQFPMTGISNVPGEAQSGSLVLTGLADGTYCHCRGNGGGFKADNTQLEVTASGRYNATTAITALRVMSSSGNITSGKFILRGRRAAA